MKCVVVLAVLSLVAVAVHCHDCTNNNPDSCTHTCPVGEIKACEKDVCACAVKCTTVDDCAECKSFTDPMGHTTTQTKHCMDSKCICEPDHHPGGDHDHHGPGGR